MNGHNQMTVEGFIKNLSHPRKQELATMLLNGTTIEALDAAGYGRINVIEMATEIRQSITGMSDFVFDYPNKIEENVAPTEVSTPEVTTPDASVTAPVANPVPEVTTPVVPETEPQVPVAPTESVNDEVPAAPVAPAVPEVTNDQTPTA
jgi:hypothetical protein